MMYESCLQKQAELKKIFEVCGSEELKYEKIIVSEIILIYCFNCPWMI